MTRRARPRAATPGPAMALLVGMLAVGDPGAAGRSRWPPRPPPAAPAEVVVPALVPVAVPAVTAAPALVTGLAAAAVQAAEAAAGGRTELAVAVLDRGTRESAASPTGTAPVLTASPSEVVVAVDVLDRSVSTCRPPTATC